MSRYNPHNEVDRIFEVSQQWKDTCLLGGGSLFSSKDLWQSEYVDELIKYYVENLDTGEGNFLDKLELQLEPANENTKLLAAEILYVLLLAPSNIKPEKKRENVSTIWNWASQSPVPADHPLFEDKALGGCGSGGVGFNNFRWKELVYAIQLFKTLLSLPLEKRRQILSDGWEFANWLEEVPDSENRQFRHMLLHLLFPDQFERVFGGTDRVAIVSGFLQERPSRVKRKSAIQIDRDFKAIREKAAEEYKSEELDFYAPPLEEEWHRNKTTNWLFTWNPRKWAWDNLTQDIQRVAQGETIIQSWSCVNKHVSIGDKAWLVRVGESPKGIFAVGNVVSEPYESEHYDESKSEAGEKHQVVDIEFTTIKDVFNDAFITDKDLSRITIDGQTWFPQASGIEIKKRSAGLLEKIWGQLSTPSSVQETTPQKRIYPINRIYYGPPGTGKTFKLAKLKEEYTATAISASREQWLADQLRDKRWFDVLVLALHNLGGHASVSQLLDHEFVVQKSKAQVSVSNLRQSVWGTLQVHAAEDSSTVKYSQRRSPLVFDKKEDSTWYLLDNYRADCPELINLANHLDRGPGAGEATHRFEFVTFHQAYSYEDFVEGIRPVKGDESSDISYEVVPGIFRRICQRAKEDERNKYALFIDEINRGNIAKIFGELITLIEQDKRAGADNAMQVTLPYSGDSFSVPINLDIYGAMNTADRSIALLDTALRRRFRFHELMPDSGLIKGSRGDGYIEDGEGGVINLRDLLDTMNQRIRFLLNRDLTLGHAFLYRVRSFDQLREVFIDQFIPLLQEHFYDDWRRIQLVFGDITQGDQAVEPQIIEHSTLTKEAVLGFDEENYDDQVEYRVAKREEITPDAIRKIYA
ncbi:MAG: AAA family ATPase [Gammaproteobacteria bacterium]